MTIRLPIIGKNHLFTPSFLIFLGLLVFYISNIEIKDSWIASSQFFTFSVIIMILKIFVITYGNYEMAISSKKWFYIIIDTILAGFSFRLAYFAIQQLQTTTYLDNYMQFMGIALFLFFVQAFFAKIKPLIPVGIFGVISYFTIFILLNQQITTSWPGQSYENFLLVSSWVVTAVEFISFILVVKRFVTR